MTIIFGGSKVYGHFGEIVQGRSTKHNSTVLISLPCPKVWTSSIFKSVQNASILVPSGLTKVRMAIDITLAYIGRKGWGGTLFLSSTAPICAGAGSSTASIISAIRSVAYDFMEKLNIEEEMMICHQVEKACDPLIYSSKETVVWASREARVCDILPPMPQFIVVGCFDGSGSLTDPDDNDYPCIDGYLDFLKKESKSANYLYALGEVASNSAKLNQVKNPKPHLNEFLHLERKLGSCGIAVAHTGSAIALLFDPEQIKAASMAYRDIAEMAIGEPLFFSVPFQTV